MSYLSPESKHALTEAARAVEQLSSAEIVISVRPASTTALVPALIAACAGGVACLAFVLFSPWSFSYEAILLDPTLAGAAAGLAVRYIPWLRASLLPARLARAGVAQAAQAEFWARGMCETRDRTGILIYVSQVERRCAVIADRGVSSHVDAGLWRGAVERMETSVRRERDGVRLAEHVRALGPLLARALPRRADDVDELVDEWTSA